MPFTGQLGATESRLGNIELGRQFLDVIHIGPRLTPAEGGVLTVSPVLVRRGTYPGGATFPAGGTMFPGISTYPGSTLYPSGGATYPGRGSDLSLETFQPRQLTLVAA